MGSTGTPIVASSTLLLAQLISETYLSVVAFGLRRVSAKAWSGAATTRNGPFTLSARKFSKKAATRLHPSGSVRRARSDARPFSATSSTPLSTSKCVRNCASFSSRISMTKCIFDSDSGCSVKGRRPERNCKAPIVRQAFAGRERHSIHFFGAQALHRVAVDLVNSACCARHHLPPPGRQCPSVGFSRLR